MILFVKNSFALLLSALFLISGGGLNISKMDCLSDKETGFGINMEAVCTSQEGESNCCNTDTNDSQTSINCCSLSNSHLILDNYLPEQKAFIFSFPSISPCAFSDLITSLIQIYAANSSLKTDLPPSLYLKDFSAFTHLFLI